MGLKYIITASVETEKQIVSKSSWLYSQITTIALSVVPLRKSTGAIG